MAKLSFAEGVVKGVVDSDLTIFSFLSDGDDVNTLILKASKKINKVRFLTNT